MVVPILSETDLHQVQSLLQASGLSFEPPYDDLVGIFEGGAPQAVGARCGRLLKMLAVAKEHQGGSLLAEVVTELIRRGFESGVDSFFVFTAPGNATTFELLNFHLLVSDGTCALLEYGNGFSRFLARHRHLVRPGDNGAVVANCNPFTRGHRYLVERAAASVDHLYLFVLSEQQSVFPFPHRLRLVQEGVADLENVTVLETSHYAVSGITFPTYFLQNADAGAKAQMELDLLLFGGRIAPAFHVKRRFVGTEPYSATTAAYNAAMHRVLPPLGVEVVEVERADSAGTAISASEVRRRLAEGKLAGLEQLVPETTLNYLLSPEGRAVWETKP